MEEDYMDFTPSSNSSSNLASLFGFTKKPLQGNSSLTYTAPKAPKRESSPAKKQTDEKQKWKIIYSKAVHAYKLENRTYISQGLIGVVISGNHDTHAYDIILYKRNKEHLSQIRILSSFAISLSPNNYASFYDTNRQNWSLMFQSSADVEQFSQKIAICKFYSQSEPPGNVIIQDLTPPTQPKVSLSNTVDVTYSSYSLKPEELSKLRGDVQERIKLSDYEFTSLSNNLTGCSENGKRVILIPHSLSGQMLGELNPNKDLLIEVKVEKIVPELENPMPESKGPSTEPQSSIDSSSEETSIKVKGASIKEALANTKFQKANLISRMARMGQATLPVKQGLSPEQSDSEEESPMVTSSVPRMSRSKSTQSNPVNRTFSQTSQNSEPSQQVSVYQSDLSWQQSQLNKPGVVYQQLVPVAASPIASSSTDPNLSVYVSESRMQATELRMGISKISEKLDLVWNKVQNLNGSETENKSPSKQVSMDPGGLLSSLQNLITENQSLKEKVEEQKEKLEQQNDKIFHLLDLNHKYLEQTSTTNEKQSANESKIKAKMESLQQRESELETANSKALDKIKILEENLSKSEELNKQLSERIEELNLEVETLKKNLEESNERKKKEHEAFKAKLSRASEMVLKLEERSKEVESENETLKSVVKAQKEEIETGNKGMKDSETKNKEYEKVMEKLKKQISDDEVKTESKIESLTQLAAKLEEEKKYLEEKLEKANSQTEIKTILPKILSALESQLSEKEESAQILTTIESVFNDVMNGTFKVKEKPRVTVSEPQQQIVTPTPRTSLKNLEATPKEKEEPKEAKAEAEDKNPAEESKENEEKKEADEKKKKEEADSRYKSYDQGWRTTKPPPPPLFDDEDDVDDWLN